MASPKQSTKTFKHTPHRFRASKSLQEGHPSSGLEKTGGHEGRKKKRKNADTLLDGFLKPARRARNQVNVRLEGVWPVPGTLPKKN